MSLLICFGTRPEAIKLAPVIFELKRKGIKFKICITSQHREMLDQVMSFFNIVPDYDLKLMQPDQTLNSLSGNILLSMDKIFLNDKPNLVLVHGDTTTSVMVAWSAYHHKIPIAHVEAGLRTFNRYSPFPEELNRQLTAKLTEIHFAPTSSAKQNLIKENIKDDDIYITGNTIVDSLIFAKSKIESFDLDFINTTLALEKPILNKFILVTGHRRENFGAGLAEICEALTEINRLFDIDIIYPVHLNPNVSSLVYNKLGGIKGIHLIDPVSYPIMLWLIRNCELIISDSGGIQEEAPSFNKKVIVTRETSERMEGVNKGYSVLVGTNRSKIIEETKKIIQNPMSKEGVNPYGDGRASEKIVHIIQDYLENKNNIHIKR